jgi:cytochrome o ubiquinol oxidase subunit 3
MTDVLHHAHGAHEDGHHDAGATKVFGFWIYLMSDCILFATLFATYAVLVNGTAGGPTGKDIFELPFVLAETMLLLLSSITFGFGMLAMNKNKVAAVNTWLFVTFLLGRLHRDGNLRVPSPDVHEAGPDRSGFLSAFFALVGTHGCT